MSPKELSEGMEAPDFTADSSEGRKISLDEFKGKKPLVLYFYPKDNTPGCTREACGFRDNLGALQKVGAAVLGVSKDSLKSHDNFKQKYELNFPLLSDPDREIMEAYGVWREKTMYGKKSMGVVRSTFLIDRDGVIRKIWRNVKVDGHVDKVMEAVRSL